MGKPKKRVKEDKYPKANADGSDSAQTGEQKRPKAKRSSSPPPLRVMAPAAAAEELAPLSAAGRLTDAMCTTAVPETPLPADTELPPDEPTAEPKGARVANAKVDTFVTPVTVEAMPPSPTPKAAPPHATPKAVTPAPVVNQDNCLLDLIIAGEAVPAVPRKEKKKKKKDKLEKQKEEMQVGKTEATIPPENQTATSPLPTEIQIGQPGNTIAKEKHSITPAPTV